MLTIWKTIRAYVSATFHQSNRRFMEDHQLKLQNRLLGLVGSETNEPVEVSR